MQFRARADCAREDARYADQAKKWPTELGKISNLALAIALVAGISVNWHAIVSLFGSWVLLASVLIALVGVALGALVGRPDAVTRTTTGLVSGLRFGSLGLIIIGLFAVGWFASVAVARLRAATAVEQGEA